ncbi:hypothetical protein CDAR_531451 [Caerostris darwini]|uniref:Peptidase aspartic putative domain-containing protein n=1 Tax=Caerostris darwini TaxID=1538125 RepID=A0AAV4R0C9_9ARAC|nr:hypothetical protein CDAR_531451 [Caerostris darwini]
MTAELIKLCGFEKTALTSIETLLITVSSETSIISTKDRLVMTDAASIQTNVDQQPVFNSTLSSPIPCETTVKLIQEYMTLLPTAIALFKDDSGKYIKIRILLDSGSQACFLSESFAKSHSLHYDSSDRISATGISTTPTRTLGTSQPSHTIAFQDHNLLTGLQLADSNCFQSIEVDLIIGADKFFTIILLRQILRSNGESIARNTRLGWVVVGLHQKQLDN